VSASSAVTINRSEPDIASQLAHAEPPLTDEAAVVSYAAAPGGRGTEVRVVLEKTGPLGAIGDKLAAVVGADPQRQLDDALRRFKQVLETGEVMRSDGSPAGTDATQQRKQKSAQPADS
jgi:uncharacterized membrane protein